MSDQESTKEHGKPHLAIKTPAIVSQREWEAARQQLLVKEKALTHSRDALAAERRRMPWLAVEKTYKFEGTEGKVSLLDLFEGRRQLIVYRAFFRALARSAGPSTHAAGVPLGPIKVAPGPPNARDTTLVYASRALQTGHRSPEGTHGLGDALVHHHRQLRHGLRRRSMARPQRVLPRRRPGVPHILHQQPRR